jgi:hypothetical protein
MFFPARSARAAVWPKDECGSLRRHFRVWILEQTMNNPAANRPADGERHPVVASTPSTPPNTEQSEDEPERLPELTFGRTPVPVERVTRSVPKPQSALAEADLAHMEACCRLKADAARWVAGRHRHMMKGANFAIDIEPVDRALIARARELPDCFLWMSHPKAAPATSDFNLYEDVAGCFEAVADVAALLRRIQGVPAFPHSGFEALLNLLAEAQSSLRVAIARVHGPADTDQVQIFNWLKETATRKQLFIERYMRLDDSADPSQWGGLYVRIEAMSVVVQETLKQADHRRKLLDKMRHESSLISKTPDAASAEWQDLASTVDELVNDGLPPSHHELRELLVPVIDHLPDLPEFPRGFQLVLREIDHFMASNPPVVTNPSDARSVTPPIPEVDEVARLLNGRSMVLIGGDRRPASLQALKNAFHLTDLIWIETREHESIDSFEASIARPDVAVVLLAIRGSSHSFGEIREFCDRHGKPLVRLPGGYNPNQVAVQILSQCSGRLSLE